MKPEKEDPSAANRCKAEHSETLKRIIICVDMDAFFASVEQRVNPALRGKPIAVIGASGRTVVTTASYEARALGVRTGMNIREARAACPQVIFVTGDTARYTHTARGLQKIFSRYTPDVEVYSIDEAFLDITTTQKLFGGPMEIGRRIKRAVGSMFGIACTVGIAPNILIAKLASDIAKPDGLRWVRQCDMPGVLEALPVDKLWGIGRKTAERLKALGIRTCGELGRAPASMLRSRFGITGEALQAMGMGRCERPIRQEEADPKSIGHSMTLPRDIWSRDEAATWLLRLAEKVGRRARGNGFKGRKIALTLRYQDFVTLRRQAALPAPTNDTHVILGHALDLYDRIGPQDAVRLLGISLGCLEPESGQMLLMPEERKRSELLRAMDSVNDRYGRDTVIWAGQAARGADPRHAGEVIAPSWKPSGVRSIEGL